MKYSKLLFTQCAKSFTFIAVGSLCASTGVHSASSQPTEQNMQKYKKGNVVHGFLLKKVEFVKEADESTAYVFEHKKTGAQLVYLSNKDDNKLFGISFRTPPANSTGIAHILEHSVLCGSKNFPSKEPFGELMKGSVNTFLNAMTYPDKTFYPVASRNAKDFRNLMHVYLDAVFYPNVLKNEDIFKQEGWRYEIDPDTQALSYNGVVYSEMKGVYSSPENLLDRFSNHALFPNTIYREDSGGDPDVIPSLTHKEFVAFHQKFYHPSNSRIVLYGDGDIAADLEFISKEYLSAYTQKKVNSKIALQKPFKKPLYIEKDYSINLGDDLKDRTLYSLHYAVGTSDDEELSLALQILRYVLLGTSTSPLKKALIDSGVGKAVTSSYEVDFRQPIFSITVKNSNAKNRKLVETTIQSTLERLVKEGISEKLIRAAIQQIEFSMREKDVGGEPKGLLYGAAMLSTWIHDGDPVEALKYEKNLDTIKKLSTQRYFEKIIEKHFLKNAHRVLVALNPVPGLDQVNAKKLSKKLAQYQKKLSAKKLAQIKADDERLKARQNAQDKPEDLEKIPLLELSDLNPKIELIPFEQKKIAKTTVYHTPVNTNGIAYVDLHFRTEGVAQQDIPYVKLLASVLLRVPTTHYTLEDLTTELDLNSGDVSFDHTMIGNVKTKDEYAALMSVKTKALPEQLPKELQLLAEIILNTQYNDTKKLQEVISELKNRFEGNIVRNGHLFASMRAYSNMNQRGAYAETTNGISYFQFIQDLDLRIQKEGEKALLEISNRLKQVSAEIFKAGNLVVDVTGSETEFSVLKPELEKLLAVLPSSASQLKPYQFILRKKHEAFIVSSKVQYSAISGDFKQHAQTWRGFYHVTQNLSSTGFLWNKIRIQNGAYGAGLSAQDTGRISLITYRDPQLKKSFDAFKELPQFLKTIDLSARELNKIIIGAIGELDQPKSPSQKGREAFLDFMSGRTAEDEQKERTEVLATTQQQLRESAALVEDSLIKDGYRVTVGGEQKINEDKALFDSVVRLMK